uniref:C-type lectin domain-containing protein n=1 Tax=Lates calcarifer TaxID=8187 RepID=A0A4W6E8A3_LATCA
TRMYHYVDIPLNFTEAQNYCREKFTDLATIRSMEDMNMLNRTTGMTDGMWIGLNDDLKSWKTALANQTCVVIDIDGEWHDRDCEYKLRSVYTNANGKSYVLVSMMQTWKEAQAYCRQYHTDLASVENAEENEALRSLITTGLVWTGLYRVPWTWSDKSSSNFTNWYPGEPDNVNNNQHCVFESALHQWSDTECSRKLGFLCHEGNTQKFQYYQDKLRSLSQIIMCLFGWLETAATENFTHTKRKRLLTFLLPPQMSSQLTNQGWTNFKLRWSFQPRKLKEEKDEDYCEV